MAKAIEQQNKKVEEQSEAMEKAIDDKGKLVDDKEEEEKFEKASEKMDAVGDAAERNFDQKGTSRLLRFRLPYLYRNIEGNNCGCAVA